MPKNTTPTAVHPQFMIVASDDIVEFADTEAELFVGCGPSSPTPVSTIISRLVDSISGFSPS